jgi:hypothetical protein
MVVDIGLAPSCAMAAVTVRNAAQTSGIIFMGHLDVDQPASFDQACRQNPISMKAWR